MKKFMFYFILTFIMSGCTAEITNLTHAKKEVQDYYESGKYDAEMNSIANDALKALEKMQIDKTTSVVIDIDECALANYPQIKLVGFGYVTKIWDDWIYSAKAKAIPQTKKIYDYLVSKGAKIIFLTGRNDKYYDATRKNLIDEKYSKIDTLICRSDKESKLSAVQHKSHYREELTKKGWKIIANIGDQWSDFEGGNSGYIIKLPNYLYFTK